MKKMYSVLMMVLIFLCASCNDGKNYSVDDYRATMKFHDDFKVMQLTDLHFGIESDLAMQLDFMCESIDEVNPDLIILTGDNFMYATKGIVKALFKTLNDKCDELSGENRVIKFAVTFGNHDNQGDYPRYYINKTIKKYVTEDGKEIADKKYAAFLDYEDDNLHGFANYYIDLVDDINKDKNEVDVKYRLHILDSNTYHYVGPGYKYELIFDDQLSHINDIYNTATTDKDYIGMCFFHIPFYEYSVMKEQYIYAIDKSLMGQGELKDKVRVPYYDNGSYIKMKEANIISFFVGHDHQNYGDYIFNYESNNLDDKAIFSYGVKSTNQLYHFDDMIGYKVFNLKDNMSKEEFISIENIKQNFKNVTDRGGDYE